MNSQDFQIVPSNSSSSYSTDSPYSSYSTDSPYSTTDGGYGYGYGYGYGSGSPATVTQSVFYPYTVTADSSSSGVRPTDSTPVATFGFSPLPTDNTASVLTTLKSSQFSVGTPTGSVRSTTSTATTSASASAFKGAAGNVHTDFGMGLSVGAILAALAVI